MTNILRSVFVFVFALLPLGCGRSTTNAAGPSGPPAFPVKVITVQAQLVPESTDYLATLKSRNAPALQPQVEGEVTKIFVHSGESVNAGAPVLEIDSRKQEATVSTQEASYRSKLATEEYDRVDLERKRKLYAAGVIPKADLDTSQSAYDAAKADAEALAASIREQKEQLRYYTVKAPTAGIIGDIPVHVGDRVTTSTTLTTVDKPGSLEVYVYVPIERAPQLKMNMPVQVLDGSGNVIADSRVSFISPQVDNTTQTVLVKARIANSRDKLRQSQFIRARVIWGTQKSPVVPILAVSRIGGQYFAFIAEPGNNGSYVARQKPLKVGQMVDNNYVVLDGVKPGDKVIVSGTQFLVDGVPVSPQSAS